MNGNQPSTDLQFQLAELARRLENLVRIGTVEEADYGRARLRVRSGELLTDWLPWMEHSASQDRSWHAPEIGEQVMLLAPSGDLAAAVVLRGLNQSAHPANGDTPDLHRLTYGNGDFIEHDRASGDMTIQVSGNFRVTAARIDLN